VALAIGIGVLIGFPLLDWFVIRFVALHPDETVGGYFIVGWSVVFIFLCFGIMWWLFRLWDRPPIRMRIFTDRIEFVLSSGVVRTVHWKDPSMRLDVIVRTGDPRIPRESMVMLEASIVPRPAYHMLTPVIPQTYIPYGADETIINGARSANLSIREESYTPDFSGGSPRRWILHRIGRP